MRVFYILLVVSVTVGRPQGNCREDSSSDVESDVITQQQEVQHSHNQMTEMRGEVRSGRARSSCAMAMVSLPTLPHPPARVSLTARTDVKQEPANRLVDYGGSSVQQRARSQPLGTPREGADQEDSSEVEVEGLSHAENNAEFQENFKEKDLIRVPIDSPKSSTLRVKENYYDNKGLKAHNNRQAQCDRDKSNTRRSQFFSGQHKIQSDSSEGDKRMIHQIDLKFNNDEKVNNEALSGNSNENPNYAADYEMDDASQNSAAGANEDSVAQKECESSFESNNEPAEYGNLDIEETRERREVKNETPKTVTVESNPEPAVTPQTNKVDGVANEETVEAKEQLAIKQHIANLSNDQLNGLLGSLPTDKRELLQQIINNRAETSKREVSTNDEATQLTNKQESANVKLQESAEKTPESRLNHESGETQAEKMASERVALNNNEEAASNKEMGGNANEPQSAVAAEDNSKAEDTITNADNIQKAVASSDVVSHEINAQANEQSNIKSVSGSEKSNNKREVKKNDYDDPIEESEDNSDSSIDLTEENNSAGSKDEPSSDYKKLDSNYKMTLSKRNNKRENPLKKECIKRDPNHALKEDLSIAEQLQALEESFPSVRSYDVPNYPSHLVRVKRNKRENLEKRSAGALVGSETDIPYRADTEDEDDDEGNEFEDDGLFDRTSNLGSEDQAKASRLKLVASEQTVQNENNINENPPIDMATVNDNMNNDAQPKFNDLKNTKDLSSIGSDSDNVFSGSDGVDENLMLTSGVRSRFSRKSDRNLNELGVGSDTSKLEDSKKTATEELQSVPNDPNGAFGGLPKNYDGELSRFKRIRRTKQLDE